MVMMTFIQAWKRRLRELDLSTHTFGVIVNRVRKNLLPITFNKTAAAAAVIADATAAAVVVDVVIVVAVDGDGCRHYSRHHCRQCYSMKTTQNFYGTRPSIDD